MLIMTLEPKLVVDLVEELEVDFLWHPCRRLRSCHQGQLWGFRCWAHRHQFSLLASQWLLDLRNHCLELSLQLYSSNEGLVHATKCSTDCSLIIFVLSLDHYLNLTEQGMVQGKDWGHLSLPMGGVLQPWQYNQMVQDCSQDQLEEFQSLAHRHQSWLPSSQSVYFLSTQYCSFWFLCEGKPSEDLALQTSSNKDCTLHQIPIQIKQALLGKDLHHL